MAQAIVEFEDQLFARGRQLRQALPAHVELDAFVQNTLTCVRENPKLLDCHRGSLFHACATAANLGLMLGRARGHGWIVPFKNKQKVLLAQFITGYKGYIHLAYQSEKVAKLTAKLVYDADEFDVDEAEDVIDHRPCLEGDRGKVRIVYAIAKLANDERIIEWMTTADVQKIRNRSAQPNSPAWANDWNQMARKTVIRRIANYLPQSVQLASALDAIVEFQAKNAYIDDGVIIEGEATEVLPHEEDAKSPTGKKSSGSTLDKVAGKKAPAKKAAAKSGESKTKGGARGDATADDPPADSGESETGAGDGNPITCEICGDDLTKVDKCESEDCPLHEVAEGGPQSAEDGPGEAAGDGAQGEGEGAEASNEPQGAQEPAKNDQEGISPGEVATFRGRVMACRSRENLEAFLDTDEQVAFLGACTVQQRATCDNAIALRRQQLR